MQSIQEALSAQGVSLERRLRKLPSTTVNSEDSSSSTSENKSGESSAMVPKPLLAHEVFSTKKLFASTISREEMPTHLWNSASVLDRR